MKFETITLPPLRVAAVHRVGPYGPDVKNAFCRLVTWAGKNHLFQGSTLIIGAYYSDASTTPPEKCEMAACITLAPDQQPQLESGIDIRTLPGGLCATSLVNIHNNDFCGAWKLFLEEAALQKLQRDETNRPCMEIYYGPPADLHPLNKWIVDIVWPLKE